MPNTAHVRMLFIISLAIVGYRCGGEGFEGEDTIAVAEDDLYYVTNSWDRLNITVCWEANGNNDEKALVRNALRGQRSWAAEAAVNFVGWHRCGTGDTYAVRITPGSRAVVTGGLGMRRSGLARRSTMELDFRDPIGSWTQCTNNGLGRDDCIQSLALHEVGHSLGFAHEHNRDDRPASCTDPESGSDGTRTWGPWDLDSIMNYCGDRAHLSGTDRRGAAFIYGKRYGDAPRAGDYNGDGRDDMLCHDRITGRKWIDFAASGGHYGATDWTRDSRWCNHDTAELFKGDFNGDGRDDLLCHDVTNGRKWVDLASSGGQFNGTNWERDARWCSHEGARLLVGDFNGDNRDDLLCFDVNDGRKWIDYASATGQFNGTNWSRSANWCIANGATVLVGDFNGDGRDDLMCHNVASGRKWIDYADTSGRFLGTNWSTGANWCGHDTAQLFVGDFNGDGRDDLLCHDVADGRKWVDLANASGQFGGTNWSASSGWCRHATGRLSVGDVNGDGRDDILCHDVVNGRKWVDFASTTGQFAGTNRSYDDRWCGAPTNEFH